VHSTESLERRKNVPQSDNTMVWNPGGAWNPTIDVPEWILTLISSMESAGESYDGNISSRTELDIHATMPVVGRNVAVISESGKTVDVCPFSHDYEPVALPVVDVAVQYLPLC
jgi:hypothetical protein